jgi:hypothetical protein
MCKSSEIIVERFLRLRVNVKPTPEPSNNIEMGSGTAALTP